MKKKEFCANLRELYQKASDRCDYDAALKLLDKICASELQQDIDSDRELVTQALGKASMCWTETPKGIFDSDKAQQIGRKLLNDLEEIKL